MAHEDDEPVLEAVPRDNPALIIQEGDFGALPQAWEHLNTKRQMLKRIIPSVGRLEIEVAGTNRTGGTAFVVGNGILMTNKHVVEDFATLHSGEGTFKPGFSVRIDFGGEHGHETASELPLENFVEARSRYDIALLRFTPTLDHIVKALVLEKTEPPPPLANREIAVIGYPGHDPHLTPDQVAGVFQNILGVKRLQPGKIRATQNLDGLTLLRHDCSTSDGNSGSCVIDLETGRVIALHFGSVTVNLAVPLWKVANEAWLRDLNWAT